MEITLIRHLPTEWNKNHMLQGKRDIPLMTITEEDQVQIKQNLQYLEKQTFEHVLCSSLQRTRQTAQLYGFEPNIEPLLDELDFGPFEGRFKEELAMFQGNKWIECPVEMTLGESLTTFEKRILLFLEKYKNQPNLLVFGHGAWIRAMKSYHKYGHINYMNKLTVNNNECVTLEFLTVEA